MSKRAKTVADLRAELTDGGVSERTLKRLAKNDPRQGARDLALRELAHRQQLLAEAERLAAMLRYENELWERGVRWIAGVDEVGVGPLAGPVVAAAVILPVGCSIDAVDDSKKLDHEMRARLAPIIRERAVAFALGSCSVEEIEKLNIYHAACEAMRRAICALGVAPEHLLVDARRVPGVSMPQTPIIGGDGLSQSIAAASIIAKVERDGIMEGLAREHPGYGFERHKGYATAEHLEALKRLGSSPLHRRSYAPVAEALGAQARRAGHQYDLFKAEPRADVSVLWVDEPVS